MLRIHLLQHWFKLADLSCEEVLYDSASLRHFVGINLGREPVFGVVKKLLGFTKLRYRGLEKNAMRAFTALALANIYLGRQALMAQVRR